MCMAMNNFRLRFPHIPVNSCSEYWLCGKTSFYMTSPKSSFR